MHALKKKGTTPTAMPNDSLVYPCCHALVLCLLWLELLAAPCYFGLYFVVVGLFICLLMLVSVLLMEDFHVFGF